MQSGRRRELVTLGLVALAGGLACEGAGLPVAWMLGPMLACILLALATGRPWSVPSSLRWSAQAALGVAVGLRVDLAALSILADQALFLLLLVLATGGLSMLNGHLLARWTGVDPATGYLGAIPGAASSVVALSDDLEADPRLVAVLQYVRVLIVAVVVPFFVEHAAPFLSPPAPPATGAVDAANALTTTAPTAPAPGAIQNTVGWADLAYLALYATAGLIAARGLRMPSGGFLGPFVVTIAGSALFGPRQFPDSLFNAALLVLGAWIGAQFDGGFLRRLGRVAAVEVALVFWLIGAAAALGYAFSLVTGIHPVTALLASSPGAMEAMVALSVKLGADTALVVSAQMFRFLAMLFTGPWIARRLVSLSSDRSRST